jgi:hypothetical protein
MPKMIEQLESGTTVGYAALGFRGGVSGSVRQQVHDGDTVNVRAASRNSSAEIGTFGVRFLGVDAPEISFTLPGKSEFTGLSDPQWEAYLSDPFAEPCDSALSPGLLENLTGRVGPGSAMNHHQHASAAERAFEEEVLADLQVLQQTEADFRFFLAFAYEVMDRYGRFLCFINRYQPNATTPEPRPMRYNERLVAAGKVSPFFIWPNIDPFRKENTVVAAVIPPGTAADLASADNALGAAREAIRTARAQRLGIFDAANPLRLQPFEIRFLARRLPPDRWVIDLSKNDNILTEPQEYYTIPNVEDRLFIPEEHVPLFEKKGWRQQS